MNPVGSKRASKLFLIRMPTAWITFKEHRDTLRCSVFLAGDALDKRGIAPQQELAAGGAALYFCGVKLIETKQFRRRPTAQSESVPPAQLANAYVSSVLIHRLGLEGQNIEEKVNGCNKIAIRLEHSPNVIEQ